MVGWLERGGGYYFCLGIFSCFGVGVRVVVVGGQKFSLYSFGVVNISIGGFLLPPYQVEVGLLLAPSSFHRPCRSFFSEAFSLSGPVIFVMVVCLLLLMLLGTLFMES